MPWDFDSVPGVTSSDNATTMTDWRQRQEERRAPHHRPPPHQRSRPETAQPETPATPDPTEPAQAHHLNVLA